jgi:hypothetical protein
VDRDLAMNELADRVRREQWVVAPESTGIWWRQ